MKIARDIVPVFGKVKPERDKSPAPNSWHSFPPRSGRPLAMADRAAAGEKIDATAEALLRQKDTAADIAMFGRMLADNPDYNREAAVQVAHAVTTHKVAVEDDYYVAVDDLKTSAEDAGAGFLGEAGFAAGLFYLYVCVDIALLRRNLSDEGLAGDGAGCPGAGCRHGGADRQAGQLRQPGAGALHPGRGRRPDAAHAGRCIPEAHRRVGPDGRLGGGAARAARGMDAAYGTCADHRRDMRSAARARWTTFSPSAGRHSGARPSGVCPARPHRRIRRRRGRRTAGRRSAAGRSALLGLLAAALGIERTEADRHAAMERGFGVAVRVDAPGITLSDYHTAQVPPARRGVRHATRRAELDARPLETILSRRDYRTDSLFTVAVWARPDAPVPLAATGGRTAAPAILPFGRPQILPARVAARPGGAGGRGRTGGDAGTPGAGAGAMGRAPAAREGELARDRGGTTACRKVSGPKPGGTASPAATAGSFRCDGTHGRPAGRTVTPMFLSRARLRADSSVQALSPLLLPADPSAGLLADAPAGLVADVRPRGSGARLSVAREAPGAFLILAPRPAWVGSFRRGQQAVGTSLARAGPARFLLRANPTVARATSAPGGACAASGMTW